MTNVRFLKGNKVNLPSVGTDDSTIYFVEDNCELFKSVGDGLPLSKISDVMSDYVDLNDLLTKNPSLEGKLYLTLENKLYTYRNNTYELLSGNIKVNADDVIESSGKVFVSSSQRSQIDSNTTELASHTQRLSDLQLAVDNVISTDEKVAMDATSVATYLSELIDGLTLKNANGKLTVDGLNGLIANINELNFLQGTTSNIQQQINNLSGVSSFKGVFTSLENLQSTPNPLAGEYAIVSDGNASDYYFYYGTNWDYSHATSGVSVIDIANGTTGALPKTRYEKQNASETSFTDASGKILATDTNTAILEVFRFADSLLKGLTQTVGSPLSQDDSIDTNLRNFKNWYANLTEAITLNGINASPSNNGNEVIQKVKAIPNISIEGTVKKKSKINVNAGSAIEVQLSSAISLTDITATLIEFVAGAVGIVVYNLEFNNRDSSNFESNENIEFDGKMKLKSLFPVNMTPNASWNEGGTLSIAEINSNDWVSINKINVTGGVN